MDNFIDLTLSDDEHEPPPKPQLALGTSQVGVKTENGLDQGPPPPVPLPAQSIPLPSSKPLTSSQTPDNNIPLSLTADNTLNRDAVRCPPKDSQSVSTPMPTTPGSINSNVIPQKRKKSNTDLPSNNPTNRLSLRVPELDNGIHTRPKSPPKYGFFSEPDDAPALAPTPTISSSTEPNERGPRRQSSTRPVLKLSRSAKLVWKLNDAVSQNKKAKRNNRHAAPTSGSGHIPERSEMSKDSTSNASSQLQAGGNLSADSGSNKDPAYIAMREALWGQASVIIQDSKSRWRGTATAAELETFEDEVNKKAKNAMTRLLVSKTLDEPCVKVDSYGISTVARRNFQKEIESFCIHCMRAIIQSDLPSPREDSPTKRNAAVPISLDGGLFSSISPGNVTVPPASLGAPSLDAKRPNPPNEPQHATSRGDRYSHPKFRRPREMLKNPANLRKERPVRAAGKSASTLISSQYEHPFSGDSAVGGSERIVSFARPRLPPVDHHAQVAQPAFEDGKRQPNNSHLLEPQNKSTHPTLLEEYAASLAISVSPELQYPHSKVVVDQKSQQKFLDRRETWHPIEVQHRKGARPAKGTHSFSKHDSLSQENSFTILQSSIKDSMHKSTYQIGSLLRNRELGRAAPGLHMEDHDKLRTKMATQLRPWRSWTGASHDVVTVAWAPNSTNFAAGAAAHSNDEDLQYNRPCNLLMGDLETNKLLELSDHYVARKKPDEVQGPSANRHVYEACDPKVYMTINSVKFSPFTNQMYSASTDQTVRIWDVNQSTCVQCLKYEAAVNTLDVSPVHPGLFATGCKTTQDAISVYKTLESGEVMVDMRLSSYRAKSRPEWEMFPECLQWGQSAYSSNLLLGGFLQWGREEAGIRHGHLCLWDATTGQDLKIAPASQAVHTAEWHPTQPLLASASTPGPKITNTKTTETVVRVWDIRESTKRVTIEYECCARDIIDLNFHPIDANLVMAGCTNRKSYVWDFRFPDKPVHVLQHGPSLIPRLKGGKDTGIMMSLWGLGGALYYTGSSDGNVLAWDVRRHPADVLVRQVANVGAGIQSGAFSPDGTHLLVGDSTGSIHLLSSAPWGMTPEDDEDPNTRGVPMDLIRTSSETQNPVNLEDDPGTQGILAAQDYLDSGEITIDPDFGAGKGPKYRGPYSKSLRVVKNTSGGPMEGIGRMQKEIYRLQVFSRKGEERFDRAEPVRSLIQARKEAIDGRRKALNNEISQNSGKNEKASNDKLYSHLENLEISETEDSDSDDEWWPHLNEDRIAIVRRNPNIEVRPDDVF